MYFPMPNPLDNEYPVILNWWEPFVVSVTEVEVVIEVEGLEVSLQTLSIDGICWGSSAIELSGFRGEFEGF